MWKFCWVPGIWDVHFCINLELFTVGAARIFPILIFEIGTKGNFPTNRCYKTNRSGEASHEGFVSRYALSSWNLSESSKIDYFLCPQPVAVGSAALSLRKVIESELLGVSCEIPVEKEGGQTQVGPLKVRVLPVRVWVKWPVVTHFGWIFSLFLKFFSSSFFPLFVLICQVSDMNVCKTSTR